MHFLSSCTTIASALSVLIIACAAAESKNPDHSCSVHSSAGGNFFDLNPLKLLPRDEEDVKPKGVNESYHVRGWDYPHNFTINFCGPVVEKLGDVEGVTKSNRKYISAFYKDKHDTIYSIGEANDTPFFRGKKLLLNYTSGSPCPDLDEHGQPVDEDEFRRAHRSLRNREIVGGGGDNDDDDDDDEDDDLPKKPHKKPSSGSRKSARTKSTLMSFNCDASPERSSHPSISFIGTTDHCTYVFEVRSKWACAGATPSDDPGTLGPGGVFGVILAIAVAVYLIGGVVYQRSVMHQRGWRQLPNYAVWSGLFGFFTDMVTILFSSCGRRMPSVRRLFGGKHGYHRVGTDSRSNGGFGRGRSSEDANRLIDSLDEEWD